MISKVDENFLQSLIDTEALYQNAPCGYVSFLPDGTIVKINATLLKWMGYPEHEILFKQKFPSLLPKGVGIYYEMYYLPLLKMKGEVNEINFDFIRKDDSTFPALINSKAIKDEAGNIRAINATVFEISDRKKYELELLNAKKQADLEKKQFQFLADLIPDIIWTATPKGHISYINRRFFEYTGLGRNQFSQFSVFKVIHPEDKRKYYHPWIHALEASKPFEAELRIKNATGVYEWYLIRSVPFKGSQEEVASKWFGSCTNINEQVEAKHKKDLFISMASHELKTPLTGIKAYVQLLLENFNSYERSQIEKYLGKINLFTGRLHNLISELLDVSLIQAGKIQYGMKAFNFAEMAKESIENAQNLSTQHKIISQLNVKERVYGDEERIAQVVDNLLTNAIKYSPKADKVLVKATRDKQSIKFSVTDYGIGIPDNQLAKIFDRYARVNNDSKVSGLGLGLYISSEIIKRHQGKIWAESELGKGSTFSFTLPIQ